MTQTNEFLRGMFAAYMGCDVQYVDTENRKIVAKLTGVSVNDGLETTYKRRRKSRTGNYVSGDYLSFKPNGSHNTDALHCKPILTPLSEITDSDAVEVAKIMEIPQFERAKLFGCDENNYYTIGRHIKNEIIETCYNDGFYLQGAVIDYLRSKHYDCGYMHIPSLISADLAISSKQI